MSNCGARREARIMIKLRRHATLMHPLLKMMTKAPPQDDDGHDEDDGNDNSV